MMKTFVQRLIIQSIALLFVAYLVPGITVTGLLPLVFAALLLGVVNAVVRPLLLLLTFPITVITLGLFVLVINGICFGLVAWLVSGFTVNGAFPAIVGALALSMISFLLNWMLTDSK